MNLDGILFLASYTTRSIAYAQAMVFKGMRPENVILFGKPREPGKRPSGPLGFNDSLDLFFPDLSIALDATCNDAEWMPELLDCDNINDPAIAIAINKIKPRFVIYSGYGGQIVNAGILKMAPFLHLHSGWLPEERGSTTIYYGMLTKRRCAVTAILLSRNIDEGPILMHKEYKMPEPEWNIDYLYDNTIRADSLLQILEYYTANKKLPEPEPQPKFVGPSYYVIHPVLKHISVLSLET